MLEDKLSLLLLTMLKLFHYCCCWYTISVSVFVVLAFRYWQISDKPDILQPYLGIVKNTISWHNILSKQYFRPVQIRWLSNVYWDTLDEVNDDNSLCTTISSFMKCTNHQSSNMKCVVVTFLEVFCSTWKLVSHIPEVAAETESYCLKD